MRAEAAELELDGPSAGAAHLSRPCCAAAGAPAATAQSIPGPARARSGPPKAETEIQIDGTPYAVDFH